MPENHEKDDEVDLYDAFIELGSRTLTETDIINFAGVSGDFYPLHTSDLFAKKSIFGKIIAHGLLTLSISSGLWTSSKIFQNYIIAFYGISSLRFIRPVYPGDTLVVKVKFLAEEEKRDMKLVSFISNTFVGKSIVMELEAKFLMDRKFLMPSLKR
ncbi:MAG: hypothetical protein M1113_00495 [Candidatus Thermoplasmatota archaeon]|jgi:acyl dehydratase|nr:hypothetical protein [Candidatus Thermoplasmatota archaeon]